MPTIARPAIDVGSGTAVVRRKLSRPTVSSTPTRLSVSTSIAVRLLRMALKLVGLVPKVLASRVAEKVLHVAVGVLVGARSAKISAPPLRNLTIPYGA